MTKIVISGYYGFDNFGDEAILSVLISKLKSPEREITVFSANPAKTAAAYGVNTICSFDYGKVFNAVQAADVLLSGGGSLLQDVTSLKSLLYYCWVILTALIFKKKVIIFAQGIGPINFAPARFLVKNLLKHCSYVSVRDEKSHELLNGWKIKNELLCDPVYSLDVPQKTGKSGFIGVQLRSFKEVNEEFLWELAKSVIQNFPQHKIEIISLQDKIDLEICKRFDAILYALNPEIKTEILSGLSISEALQRLSGLDYLIGMRFHALLIAVKSGVKSLAVNYDIKVKILAEETGIPLIELNDYSDYAQKMELLKNLPSPQIQKTFDWSGLEHLLV